MANRGPILAAAALALVTLSCQLIWPTATPAPTLPPPAGEPTQPAPTPSPTTPPQPTYAKPTPALPPTAPPPSDILFEDDFNSPNSGWEVGDYDDGSVGYGDGYYFVISRQQGKAMWGLGYQDFTDLVIEVDATQVSGPANNNNGYGVKCRVQPVGTGGDGYAFLISGDGYYSIHVVSGGHYESLVDWTPTDAVRQGNATNHLRAICDGSHLALFVNGQLVGETEDTTYTSGDISLIAVTLEPEATEVRFDNLVVTAP